jgi:hypothetical protein
MCIEPPLPLEYPPIAAGELGHDALRVHPAGQHVAVVAVGGDALVAFLRRGLETHDDGFLPDVEVTEPPDEAHPVELARLLLEAADQEHFPVVVKQFVLRDVRRRGGLARGHAGGSSLKQRIVQR